MPTAIWQKFHKQVKCSPYWTRHRAITSTYDCLLLILLNKWHCNWIYFWNWFYRNMKKIRFIIGNIMQGNKENITIQVSFVSIHWISYQFMKLLLISTLIKHCIAFPHFFFSPTGNATNYIPSFRTLCRRNHEFLTLNWKFIPRFIIFWSWKYCSLMPNLRLSWDKNPSSCHFSSSAFYQ